MSRFFAFSFHLVYEGRKRIVKTKLGLILGFLGPEATAPAKEFRISNFKYTMFSFDNIYVTFRMISLWGHCWTFDKYKYQLVYLVKDYQLPGKIISLKWNEKLPLRNCAKLVVFVLFQSSCLGFISCLIVFFSWAQKQSKGMKWYCENSEE